MEPNAATGISRSLALVAIAHSPEPATHRKEVPSWKSLAYLKGIQGMTEPTNARNAFGDITPKLAEITDKVLFGDVWRDPALSQRDRSLVTITTLIALYRTNELPFHLKLAIENGLTKDEIVAALTHLAFYAGWPPAMTGLQIARKVFDETDA